MLGLPESAANEEITRSFKRLAHQYHPDKNLDRVKWATDAMTNLNMAYTTILTQRFGDKNINGNEYYKNLNSEENDLGIEKNESIPKENFKSILQSEILTSQFVKIRESANEALYRYFQYGLYNLVQREQIASRGKFNGIVFILRKCFHALQKLAGKTDDEDFIEHFDTFRLMLFDFYRASECLNILDSYSNIIDVEAYRLYKNGDDVLHASHKEIFYDRHNRGFFRREIADSLLLESEGCFKNALKTFPRSTWAVETKIKLDYTLCLKDYIALFFTEE